MFSWIVNWLKPDVTKILGDFEGTISRLEYAMAWHQGQQNKKATEAQKLLNEASDHITESNRAHTVADKIKELIK